MMEGPGADSEEKHEPVSDIDTAVVVVGLKALDPEWPIREAIDPLRTSQKRDSGCKSTSCEALARENEARRRTVREQSALGVDDAAFCCADTTATVEDFALGPDLTSLQRDGSDKRNLELQRRAADALIEHRLDG
jgi:hypothetical protein